MFDEAREWADSELGSCELGDRRRTKRAVQMLARAARSPAGLASSVFTDAAERQGAYDFLESSVGSEPLVDSIAAATAARAAELDFVYVPVDGTSLSLSDRKGRHGFGSVGSRDRGASGLKVVDALAVSPTGVTLGHTALEWWARSTSPMGRSSNRAPQHRESRYWLDAIAHTMARWKQHAPQTKLWFQLDREGDGHALLRTLAESGQWFTIRSCHDRKLFTYVGRQRPLSSIWRKNKPVGEFSFEALDRKTGRRRTVTVHVSFAAVTLRLYDAWFNRSHFVHVTAVRVRELKPRRAVDRIEWTLLTNHHVQSFADARDVVFGYAQRWRIEEFHRAWKTGVCNVEATQLRSLNAVAKWATLLAAVATRAERLKKLARTTPDEPVSVEFSPSEIRALIFLKRKNKKRTETITDDVPTVALAALWLAQMGGYDGNPAKKPPGAITIARGLKHVLFTAEILDEIASRN